MTPNVWSTDRPKKVINHLYLTNILNNVFSTKAQNISVYALKAERAIIAE